MTDESETGSPNKPNTLPTLPEAPPPSHAPVHTSRGGWVTGVGGKMTKIMELHLLHLHPIPHQLPLSQ